MSPQEKKKSHQPKLRYSQKDHVKKHNTRIAHSLRKPVSCPSVILLTKSICSFLIGISLQNKKSKKFAKHYPAPSMIKGGIKQ